MFHLQKYGNACLGILNGTEVGLSNLNVIGGKQISSNLPTSYEETFHCSLDETLRCDCGMFSDISLLDHMVVYDNEKQHIGWVRAACDRLPKSGISSL